MLATSTGAKLGAGYVTLLERLSEKTMETGRARNKRFQEATKADERGDAAKASRIRHKTTERTRSCGCNAIEARLPSRQWSARRFGKGCVTDLSCWQ